MSSAELKWTHSPFKRLAFVPSPLLPIHQNFSALPQFCGFFPAPQIHHPSESQVPCLRLFISHILSSFPAPPNPFLSHVCHSCLSASPLHPPKSLPGSRLSLTSLSPLPAPPNPFLSHICHSGPLAPLPAPPHPAPPIAPSFRGAPSAPPGSAASRRAAGG